MKLLHCSVIIVSDQRACSSVSQFFESLFDESFIIKTEPCVHFVLTFSEHVTLVLVQADICQKDLLMQFSMAAVRRLFISVVDLDTVLSRATYVGGNVTESTPLSCTIEGPEGIVVRAFASTATTTSDEHIISSLLSFSTEMNDNDDITTDGDTSDSTETRPLSLRSSPKEKTFPRPQFNSLNVTLFTNSSKNGAQKKSEFIPFVPNTKPTPFETDLFTGSAFLAVRSSPLDENYRDFFVDSPQKNNKRQFEVQVQGRFKKVPEGLIYVGADAIFQLQLGLLTQSFVKAVLSFLKTLVNNLHYSFGDSKSVPGYETAHVVAPLFSTMDKVVVTPAGEVPPSMGVPFPDDLELRKIRLDPARCDTIEIIPGATYSFSLNSNNIALPEWQVMGIPMLKPLSINMFSGGGPFSLVAYEIPRDPIGKRPRKHSCETMKYILNVQIASIDPGDEPAVEFVDEEEESCCDVDKARRSSIKRLSSIHSSRGNKVNSFDFGLDNECDEDSSSSSGEEDDQNDDYNDDTMNTSVSVDAKGSDNDGEQRWQPAPVSSTNSSRQLKKRQSETLSSAKHREKASHSVIEETKVKKIENWIRREISGRFLGVGIPAIFSPEPSKNNEIVSNIPFMEGLEGDLKFCPAIIEFAYSHRGRKKWMMLFAVPDQVSAVHSCNTKPKLRSSQDFSKNFSFLSRDHSHPKCVKNVDIFSIEKTRQQVALTYQAMFQPESTKYMSGTFTMMRLQSFLSTSSDADNNFLMASGPSFETITSHRGASRWSGEAMGTLVLCTDRRIWTETNLVVNKEGLSIGQKEDPIGMSLATYKNKPNPIAVSRESILHVRSLGSELCPFHGFGFLEIETFFKVYLFMVKEQSDAEAWVQIFVKLFGDNIKDPARPLLNKASVLPDFNVDVCFGRPSSLKLGKRRVFNYRRTVFPRHSTLPAHLMSLTPNEVTEKALQEAFELLNDNTNARLWVKFMDTVSALQVLDLSALTSVEKMAFLLNLYHIMVIHGTLVLGPPLPSSWGNFFSTVSYLVGFDVVSIKELECNGLRSAMNKCSNILGKKNKSKPANLGLLALDEFDFRLNFCINCGTRSTPSFVPIFTPETVDEQMDEMTSLVLAETAQIDQTNRTVVLPRVCSWYLRDFCAPGNNNNSCSSNNNSMKMTAPRLRHSSSTVGIGTSSVLPINCVKVIAPYLRDTDRQVLVSMLQDGISSINIRFRPYSFRSRFLQKYVSK